MSALSGGLWQHGISICWHSGVARPACTRRSSGTGRQWAEGNSLTLKGPGAHHVSILSCHVLLACAKLSRFTQAYVLSCVQDSLSAGYRLSLLLACSVIRCDMRRIHCILFVCRLRTLSIGLKAWQEMLCRAGDKQRRISQALHFW